MAAAAVCGLALMGILAWSVATLMDPATLPIDTVRVEGGFRHVSKARIREVVGPETLKGFFSTDVAGIRDAVLQLPWVHRVSVRRIWPGTVEIRIAEQRALATWAEDGLVNAEGEVFRPAPGSRPAGLPVFRGPPGSAGELLKGHRAMTRVLNAAGLKIARLKMDERRAWSIELGNGMVLALGRRHGVARLRRFVTAYRTALAKRTTEVEYVDLRYTNGFAVRWAERADSSTARSQGEKSIDAKKS